LMKRPVGSVIFLPLGAINSISAIVLRIGDYEDTSR
jgi:hypothetical protein